MKQVTENFKKTIPLAGRMIDSKITYYDKNNVKIELGAENLNSITPHFEGGILKSVMKQLDIDCDKAIPLSTEITYLFGLKVGSAYEYINFGNYIVYSVEKQEDTNSYKIICYDKMLYSMKPYNSTGITFPTTIREFINSICDYLGLEFKNKEEEFANYNKIIPNEKYLDAKGQDIGYTFRDVLDELAQVTASTICLDNNNKLEIRYITDTEETINEEYLKDINVNFGEKYGKVNSIVLSRAGESDNIYLRDEESVQRDGLCEIKIVENQIMNDNDRFIFLQDILNKLNGLEFYVNDFSSTGIGYLELCDRYNVKIGEKIYSCVLFNDEFNVTQGLEELIHTDMPKDSETDYTKSDKTDRRINKAYVIVDKQNSKIESLVEQVETTEELNDERIKEVIQNISSVEEKITATEETISVIQQEIINGKGNLQNTLVTININGINVSTNLSAISTLITNQKFEIKSGDTTLAYFGYDEELGTTKSEIENVTVKNYLVTGYHRIQKYTNPQGEERTGFFWIGG